MKNKAIKLLQSKSILLVMLVMITSNLFIGCSSSKAEEATDPVVEQQVEQPADKVEEGFSVNITDSTGTEITLTQKPERIVSLAPSTTEILYFLGLEDKIVGRTKYCSFPESLESVTSVGGTSDPNIEAIVDLTPDLVVASTHVSEEVIGKLRETDIPVAFLNEQEGFEGTYSAITNIGLLTGTEEEAEKVVTEMKVKVEEIANKLSALNKEDKPKVYYAVGFGEKDSTAGGNTFIGEMITLAGGDNIAKDIEGWSFSKELIAANEPDIIIVPSERDMISGMQTTDFYKDLKAVKEGQVYEINGDMVSRQGPRVADALIEMTKIINPEIE